MTAKVFTNLNKKMKLILFFLFYQTLFLIQVYSQTITVKGSLVASRLPVKNASVAFVDNADTTIKYSAFTDASGNYEINITITSVNTGKSLPSKFELDQNYPNPFSSKTTIPYGLNKESDVQVTIYDILGRVVRKFNVGRQSVGTHNVLWDGRNNFGQTVATGVYFYRLYANGESQVKKMIFNQIGNNIVLPHTYSLTKNSISSNVKKIQSIEGNTFTVRIQNTNTTLPLIVPEKLENIVVYNDTTINFSLSYIPLATVNLDSLHQIIRGYGAANIVGWRPDMSDSEITTAFGTGNGQLGFTILRLRISPDSTQWISNVQTAKKAYDMGVKIIASPWTPPASMKSNNSLIGGELNESSYADYAAYLNAFGDFMAAHGVPVYSISLQNEPDANVNYESCDWNASQFLNFCKNNVQSIDYRVMMPESQNFVHALSDPTLNDSAAATNISIIAGHIYGGGLTKYPLAESKGKEVWMTEHLTESSHSANVWSYAIQVASEMQQVMIADMSAYVWWYIVRYYGPIGDGETSTSYPNENYAKKGELTKKGYVMSQFARFIRPGYYRVESSVYPYISSISVTAYKDSLSSKNVIVAINTSSTQAEILFKLQSGTNMITFTPYTTSASKNCEQGSAFNVTDGNFTYTMESSSITTFVSN